MALATGTAIESTVQLLRDLFPVPLERVGFRLWDGSLWPDDRPRRATIVLPYPGALRDMFGSGTEKALAESFLHGEFEIEGDTESAFEIADVLRERVPDGWMAGLRNYYRLHSLPGKSTREAGRTFSDGNEPLHSRARDRRAVSFHYDLSNAFYELWLDRRMVYSCAYFEREDTSLDDAQTAKLNHLCRKLRLRPGQRLLDIGCGWGGLAMFAARRYGAHVTGITLSREQADYAAARVRSEGLARAVSIELKDYREVAAGDGFDAIVSVGMSEHVGARHLPDYFRTAAGLLRTRGVFLNHAIGDGVKPAHRLGPSFMEEYIFPDGETPAIPVLIQAAESAGLEVRDVENLREHYALTLRHWLRRLEAAHPSARQHVDETIFRAWRLYLAGSAHAFDRAHLAVYQTLLSKPDPRGHSGLPLTRQDWYQPA